MTEVKIIYCSPSGFATQAKELQNLIADEFKSDVKVKLEKGDKGIFDVYPELKTRLLGNHQLRYLFPMKA